MTIKSYKFLLVALCAVALSATAQPSDTLLLSQLSSKADLFALGTITHTPITTTAPDAWKELSATPRKTFSSSTIGFTKDIYWLGFILQNDSEETLQRFVSIENPQIDFLTLYRFQPVDNFLIVAEGGDKIPFHARPLINRNFVFPIALKPGEAAAFLLKVDKHDSALSMPVFLWNSQDHAAQDYQNNLGYGLIFGMSLLCAIYALLVFIFLRHTLYLWYFLWIAFSFLYMFTALGFSYQYLYPNLSNMNSYFRVYLEVFGCMIFAKFAQQFLNIQYYFPAIHKWINYILLFLLSLIVVSPVALGFFSQISTILLPTINTIFVVSGLLIFYAAFASFSKQASTSMFFFLAFGSLAAGAGLVIFAEFGWVAESTFAFNPVMVGSTVELFIFSIGLTYQIRNVYNERNQLSLSIAKQQKALLKAYVEGTEKERERISRELHDDIGSRLGSLKRFINYNQSQTESLEQQIDILCHDVRTMSHQLAPPSMRITGFRQLIQKHLEETIRDGQLQVDVQFYDVPENLSPESTHQLFRIVQEAVANVLKHAQATELDLQFFVHDQELVMTIEDNGKGFDSQHASQGIGLQNMKARTESLTGTMEVSSQPGKGTSIMIKIPLNSSPV